MNRLRIAVEPSEGAKSIDPKIPVIVSALTLASTMSGFGRPMCPLNVLRPSVRTYNQPLLVCTQVQSKCELLLYAFRD